ncbi:uncharacterized protein N7496_008169 [Penicillium cataractarum]|uniref:Transcription factor domain-containing protein n=1 Tax=Penicillium cataractarum TaxID=2100454 RepID=A0A9W9V5G8_9EURO|nr:uncharacterized protein N7496_008169 [Penicillium cataractarum]KAJ5368409.1 hypothetical protein N7496_008169 [Penicillium cataractarum]
MVNHPFIHLVALKGRSGISHSSNFLQQTIDQAIFHSGWVFRLVRTCEELEFELHNPLIGHLVAATATIPWIFQFAKDQQVSSNADRDLGTCARFLSRAATTWPSIPQKFDALRNLQSVAESDLRSGPSEPRTIRFQPSVLWNLLDPKFIRSTKHKQTAREGILSRSDSGQDTHMRIATNFVHPLVDEQSEQPVLSDITAASAFPGVEELEQLPMSELFTQFSSNDLNWLYP